MRLTDTARPLRLFLIATPILALLLAACSGGTTTTPTTAAATSTAAASQSASASASESAEPSDGGASGEMTVTLQNFAFSPTTLTVPVGSTVTFENKDATEHTATNGKDGQKADDALFDIKLATGASDTFTFDKAGTYDVTCLIHPSMNMTITVQ